MTTTIGSEKQQLMSPYLIVAGISFFAYAGIRIHEGINAFISPYPIPYFESIIAIVCFFVGFASIIVMSIVIGMVYEKRINTVIGAIVFLVLFITYEAIISFVPAISYISSIWADAAILITYGIIRGIASTTANKSLRIPIPGYGAGALGFYGWSFLITTILSIVTALIAGVIYSYGLLNFALIVILIQYFLDAICLLIVGLNFIMKAINNPSIKGQVFTRPTTTTTVPGTLTTTLAQGMDEPQQIDTPMDPFDSGLSETKPSKGFCSNCGAEFLDDSDYCSFCGEVKK
ncbi:MAG: hypothetical protein FK733_14060 [Asgard group archaeon]|nr:hypothetical protein [Asgard group archaeon]